MACDRRYGDGDESNGHCYRIETVMQLIDMMAIVMDFVVELNL